MCNIHSVRFWVIAEWLDNFERTGRTIHLTLFSLQQQHLGATNLQAEHSTLPHPLSGFSTHNNIADAQAGTAATDG